MDATCHRSLTCGYGFSRNPYFLAMNVTLLESEALLPIGTSVYIPISNGGVQTSRITGYQARILKTSQESEPVAIVSDYVLEHYNNKKLIRDKTLTNLWKSEEFCVTEEEAKKLAVSYSVTATQEQWLAAIGLNKDSSRTDVSIEDCEMPPCCASISDIRDVLCSVMHTGEIDGIDRQMLIHMLATHTAPDDIEELNTILSQIGIVWSTSGLIVDGKKYET